LKRKAYYVKTPKECLKSAFRIGLIEDEEVFLYMLEDRNKTSQLYSKQEMEEVFEHIRKNYIECLQTILVLLSK
jgi:nucleotidyltransferase substrate binding protein (TIGR01987 family)